jgi:class 3 adenylate cyclase
VGKLRAILTFAACAIWAACGFALPVILLGELSTPTLAQAALIAASAILISIASQVRFSFGPETRRLEIGLDTAFVILSALILSPAVTAVVVALGSFYGLRREAPLRLIYLAANSGTAAGLASLAVASFVAQPPAATLVLPAALLAAFVRNLVLFAGKLLLEEAQAPGAGAELYRGSPLLSLFLLELTLPVAAVAMAAPHLSRPAIAFTVTAAFCGVTWLVLRILHRQVNEQQDNDYLRETVSRYMPTQVAEHLIDRSESRELGGTQHEVTVMFCDIRGFTSWAERNQPDDVINELNRLLSDLSQAVLDTDGTLDKFTGDGLMAFWGAPDPQDDHAVRAMQSVPRMLMRVREFNMERQARGEEPLEVGIGVNSGLAMVGNIGHKQRLNYTAVGDTVNLAARMEQSTKQFNCPLLVSESTFLALPTSIQRQLVRLDSISVKGRRERVRLYTLLTLARFSMDMGEKNSA